MSGRFFLDTNVLIYSFDASAPHKQQRALALIEQALRSGQGTLSWQVIQEFINVALRKFAQPMTTADSQLYLESVLVPLCSIWPGPDLYRSALDVRNRTGFSFYDSLIVAAALAADCETLYSEDMQDARKIDALKIENPFR